MMDRDGQYINVNNRSSSRAINGSDGSWCVINIEDGEGLMRNQCL